MTIGLKVKNFTKILPNFSGHDAKANLFDFRISSGVVS